MSLGACRLKRRALVLTLALWASLHLSACGGGGKKSPPSGLQTRVLASQAVTAPGATGGLTIIDGFNDTLIPGVSRIGAGSSPGLMARSPSRNIVAAFDSSSNTVYAVDTTKETDIGPNGVKLPGPTNSLVVPSSSPTGYAAVPAAFIDGFPFLGGVEVMNFTASALSTTIAVTDAQTVVSNSTGSQLLVFSNNSNSVAVLSPGDAIPPVDLSCYVGPPTGVCSIVPGFDRPVNAVVNGNTAYIMNCGPQCGGNKASVMVFDMNTLTITNTIPVDAATMGFLSGSTLYVAGTPPTNNACTGQQTAATTCGRLDIIDLDSGKVTSRLVITDGYHWRMDMSINGQFFIGSYNCTEIGNVDVGGGEIRGCLTIYNTNNNSVLVPGDNGDVTGLQSFTSREIEYVAQGGNLRVYRTDTDGLLIDDFLPFGTINVVGYVGDVKAIDFF
jgi:hypothetical protein